jgi:hypothetical protein
MRVEIAGRLVGQQQARRIGDGAANGDALLLAAGQFAGKMVEPLAEAEEAQELGRARLGLGFAEAANPLRQDDILQRSEFRQQMVELVDEADLGAAQPCRPLSSSCVVGTPPTKTSPASGLSSRPATCSRVDLPVPLGATSATSSPGQIAKSALRRISSGPSDWG